jgi:hypothetical protein
MITMSIASMDGDSANGWWRNQLGRMVAMAMIIDLIDGIASFLLDVMGPALDASAIIKPSNSIF